MQRLHGFLHPHVSVEAMNLQKVDVIGVQARQTSVNLLDDGLAGKPVAARAIVHCPENLGGEYHLFSAAVAGDRSANNLLRAALAVNICRVPQGDAQVDGLPEKGLSSGFVEGPPVVALGGAKTEAAERDAADFQSGASEGGVFHEGILASQTEVGSTSRY